MTQRRTICGNRSRHSFLKTTAAALPALGMTGVHAAGDDTIRLGLIGCGERGTGAAFRRSAPIAARGSSPSPISSPSMSGTA